MALTRVLEENEVPAGVRRIYDDVRSSFNIPFVPTVFKLAANVPDYLLAMWDDLAPVVRSREFQAAGGALDEYLRSQVIQAGWRFHDQQASLAAHRFSRTDVELLGLTISTFTHALPRLALFTRLLQRGYSGGQPGRVTAAKQASATSRLMTLNIPAEREAALRVWLIYGDIRRQGGVRHIPAFFRLLAPYPGYLASVWGDTKKLFNDPSFRQAREDSAQRMSGYLRGLPVRDHHSLARKVTPAQWRDIEETVDGMTRGLPQFCLAMAVWWRSFPLFTGRFAAA
jgi:hypothetical protein